MTRLNYGLNLSPNSVLYTHILFLFNLGSFGPVEEYLPGTKDGIKWESMLRAKCASFQGGWGMRALGRAIHQQNVFE